MPKTGTSSLQKALRANAQELLQSGLLYPNAARSPNGVAHHEIPAQLNAGGLKDNVEIGAFFDELRAHQTGRTLISSEAFTNTLSPGSLPALNEFLTTSSDITPCRLVFTLRRIDEFLQSMYLHQIKVGEVNGTFQDYLAPRLFWFREKLECLANITHSGVVQEVSFVKYEAGPTFMTDLMDKLGLDAAQKMLLDGLPRENRSLGQKAQIFLLHFDKIRTENPMLSDENRIRNELYSGRFEFEDDATQYSLISYRDRLLLHEIALRASLEFGQNAYFDFFADAVIEDIPAAELHLDKIKAADIEALTSHLMRA